MNSKAFLKKEFLEPILNYKYWMVLAETSVKHKYNRTILGPYGQLFQHLFSITMGLVFTYLFKIKLKDFFHMLLWVLFLEFFSITITQGCYTFMTHKKLYDSVSKPFLFMYL